MGKAEELRRFDETWLRLTELVGRIDARVFVEPAGDGWSPKDHVAHMTAWEEFLLALLEKRDRYSSMGAGDLRDMETTDEINDAVFRSRRNLTAEDVLGAWARTHAKVRSAIDSLSEDDLLRPRSDFEPDGDEGRDGEVGEETLLDEIGWNTWAHYEKHIGWLAALIHH